MDLKQQVALSPHSSWRAVREIDRSDGEISSPNFHLKFIHLLFIGVFAANTVL